MTETKSQFTAEELNLLRQWFNAVEDLAPEYLEAADRQLALKIFELSPLRPAGTADEHGVPRAEE